MLIKDNRNFIFILFISLFSCNNLRNKADEHLYRKVSETVIEKVEYEKIYYSAKDSISNWIRNGMKDYKGQAYYDWKLDSLLCFNELGNKFISALHTPCTRNGCLIDDIVYFYGIYINEKWHFFRGSTVSLQREYYQENIHTPLSFEKLHEIALEEIYRGYLKKTLTGWEINDNFFSDLTSVAWCTNCKTQEDWDNAYMRIVRENWQNRDTTVKEAL